MAIEIVLGYDRPEDVRALFTEYTDLIIANDEGFREYLALQHFDEEILHLEAKYGLPGGRLDLMYVDGALAGCIALRKLDEENCEMKRLYVRPQFRGMGLGYLLAEDIIDYAREAGYRYMLLDTFPFLEAAIRIYRNLGFYEIEQYNDNPMANSVYLKLDL